MLEPPNSPPSSLESPRRLVLVGSPKRSSSPNNEGPAEATAAAGAAGAAGLAARLEEATEGLKLPSASDSSLSSKSDARCRGEGERAGERVGAGAGAAHNTTQHPIQDSAQSSEDTHTHTCTTTPHISADTSVTAGAHVAYVRREGRPKEARSKCAFLRRLSYTHTSGQQTPTRQRIPD